MKFGDWASPKANSCSSKEKNTEVDISEIVKHSAKLSVLNEAVDKTQNHDQVNTKEEEKMSSQNTKINTNPNADILVSLSNLADVHSACRLPKLKGLPAQSQCEKGDSKAVTPFSLPVTNLLAVHGPSSSGLTLADLAKGHSSAIELTHYSVKLGTCLSTHPGKRMQDTCVSKTEGVEKISETNQSSPTTGIASSIPSCTQLLSNLARLHISKSDTIQSQSVAPSIPDNQKPVTATVHTQPKLPFNPSILGKEPLGKGTTISLSELVKARGTENSASGYEQPYSPATSNNQQICSGSTSPGNGSVAKLTVSSLSELARAYGVDKDKSTTLSPLHSSIMPGTDTGSGNMSTGPSLGLSLANLAQKHRIQKQSGEQVHQGSASIPITGPLQTGSSLALSKHFNKTDKSDIMLSLSSLVEKRATVDQKSKDPGSTGTSKHSEKVKKGEGSSIVIKRHSAKRSREETGNQVDSDHWESSKKTEESEAVKGENKPGTIVNQGVSPVISLADLIKHKIPATQNKTASHSKGDKVQVLQDSVKTGQETVVSELGNFDIQVQKLENDFRKQLDICDEIRKEDFQHFLKYPSSIANTFCLNIVRMPMHEPCHIKYKYRHFSYKYQTRSCHKDTGIALGRVTPFDFSTPSPDDIVKAKQKLAYNRSGQK